MALAAAEPRKRKAPLGSGERSPTRRPGKESAAQGAGSPRPKTSPIKAPLPKTEPPADFFEVWEVLKALRETRDAPVDVHGAEVLGDWCVSSSAGVTVRAPAGALVWPLVWWWGREGGRSRNPDRYALYRSVQTHWRLRLTRAGRAPVCARPGVPARVVALTGASAPTPLARAPPLGSQRGRRRPPTTSTSLR